MHTLSGRRFDLGGKFVPGIHDIAVGLSRIPRWAGATIRDWSVLQHSLAAYMIAEIEDAAPFVQLGALMHDMEEIATGDIPSPFKTEGQRILADKLREWMYRGTFGFAPPKGEDMEIIHRIDQRLVVAEAHTLVHPLARSDFPEPWDLTSVDAVWSLIGTPVDDLIEMFEYTARTLSDHATVRALRQRG